MRTFPNEAKQKGLATEQIDKSKTKQSLQFSRREMEELMGTNRDTYKRVNGAVRRK